MLSVCDGEVLAGEVFGLKLVRLGCGFGGGLMMKAMGLERPLFPAPEAGFSVMIVATPGLAISAAGTTAVSFKIFPALSRVGVVLRELPFHCTTVFVTKPWPFTVRVKSQGVVGVGTQTLVWAGERKEITAPVLF